MTASGERWRVKQRVMYMNVVTSAIWDAPHVEKLICFPF